MPRMSSEERGRPPLPRGRPYERRTRRNPRRPTSNAPPTGVTAKTQRAHHNACEIESVQGPVSSRRCGDQLAAGPPPEAPRGLAGIRAMGTLLLLARLRGTPSAVAGRVSFVLPPPCVCLRSGRILRVSRTWPLAPTRWALAAISRERREWEIGNCGRATDPHPMAPVCLSRPLYA